MPFFERNGLNATAINGRDPLEKGFIDVADIFTQLVLDLKEAGTVGAPAFVEIDSTATVVVLEAKGSDPIWADIGIDPENIGTPAGFELIGNQNWRIGLQLDNAGDLVMHWGTAGQLPDVSYISSATIPNTVLISAALVGRSGADIEVPSTIVPWHYMLTTTDRGFGFIAWGQGYENMVTRKNTMDQYSKSIWLQRLTNTISGDIQDSSAGKTPVFAVYSDIVTKNVLENDLFQETPGFILSPVRDVSSPVSQTLPGTKGELNKHSQFILYTFDYEWFQPSTLDSFNHVIKFPFGIGTIRNIYLEEMDIIGLVYSGSFQEGQTVDIDMFTPIQARTYKAGPGNTGYTASRENVGGSGNPPPRAQYHNQPQSRLVMLSAGTAVTDLSIHV